MKNTEGWFHRFLVYLAESKDSLRLHTPTQTKEWPSRRVILTPSLSVLTDLGYEAATPDLTRALCIQKKREEKSSKGGSHGQEQQ